MSFYSEVKSEMISTRSKRECCRHAEGYAYMLLGKYKTKSNVKLRFLSEDEANYIRYLFKKSFGISCSVSEIDEKFLLNFDLIPEEILKAILNDRIDKNILVCDNCLPAFLKGAFLSCGKISDPIKEYHAEFVFKNEKIAFDFLQIVSSLFPLARLTERKNKYVVYIKDSESIENLLTAIDAPNNSLHIMQTTILKNIRNHENRLNNFANANLKKTTDSGFKYLQAIQKLEESNELNNLPDNLQKIAISKRDNFEMSLNELAEMLKMSRSTVYRGLNKIVKISEKI